MRMVLVNIFLSLFAGWLALLDHCLIVSAGMPVTSQIAFLLVVQASIIVCVIFSANGAFTEAMEMVASGRSNQIKFLVFVFPLILLFISPFMISSTMYEARYGLDKFVVHAHAGHDLSCCLNPLVAMGITPMPSENKSLGSDSTDLHTQAR